MNLDGRSPAPPWDGLRDRLESQASALDARGDREGATALRALAAEWWSEQTAWCERMGGLLGVHHEINNALVGVHSTSTDAPMTIANFPRRYSTFADATDYTQWQFVFTPPSPRAAGLAPGQVPGQNGLAPAPVSPGLPALGAPTVGLGRGH